MATLINTVMTQKLVCVYIGTSLFEAHELMKEKRFRHLPVLDLEDQIIGIISQRDLQFVPDSKNLTVEMLMTTPVEYVDTNTPLRKAILLMLEKKISSLLVMDSNQTIVGIVTTDDILWHLAHLLSEKPEEHNEISLPDIQTIGVVANQVAQTGI